MVSKGSSERHASDQPKQQHGVHAYERALRNGLGFYREVSSGTANASDDQPVGDHRTYESQEGSERFEHEPSVCPIFETLISGKCPLERPDLPAMSARRESLDYVRRW
jgi:hypothetical protein